MCCGYSFKVSLYNSAVFIYQKPLFVWLQMPNLNLHELLEYQGVCLYVTTFSIILSCNVFFFKLVNYYNINYYYTNLLFQLHRKWKGELQKIIQEVFSLDELAILSFKSNFLFHIEWQPQLQME